MPAPIAVRHRHGIHLPEPDLWLDPARGKERAFISHAHSDHFARHEWTLCSEPTTSLIAARYGKRRKGETLARPYHAPVELNGFSLKLLPAGHILGSAMLHVTRPSDGATLLYTGDFKLRESLTTPSAELVQADTLILETTFGLPHYIFPPREQVFADMQRFVAETIAAGAVPVLLGYSLGKAQELLAACGTFGHPIMVHETITKFTAAFAQHGQPLPEHREFVAAESSGHVVIAPPNSLRDPCGKTFRTAMATGWALTKGAKYRFGVNEIFPLSDHADHAELLQCIERVQPRLVYTVHGYTTEFARELRQRGIEAWSLVKDEQRELALA